MNQEQKLRLANLDVVSMFKSSTSNGDIVNKRPIQTFEILYYIRVVFLFND